MAEAEVTAAGTATAVAEQPKTAEDMLQEVNNAITSVLLGGQSYTIGSRQLSRADLRLLREMQKELQAEVAAGEDTRFFDDTYVAFFDGR